MTWYCVYGDPRWDEDELWSTMGHLYKGGMWFLKKIYISGFRDDQATDGTDWRTAGGGDSWITSTILPSATNANKYFYLPALGGYGSGQLYDVGIRASYWSSSAFPFDSYNAYNLFFFNNYLSVKTSARDFGYRVDGGFE